MNAIYSHLSNLFKSVLNPNDDLFHEFFKASGEQAFENESQHQNGFSLDMVHYKEQGCDAERSTLYFDTIEDVHAFLITQAKHNNGYITYVRGYIKGREDEKIYGCYGILNGSLDSWECYITNKTFRSSSLS